MKNRLFLAALVCLAITGCTKQKAREQAPPQSGSAPCLPAPLQSGLLAFYPFSGGSINDFSGNGHHLNNSTAAHPGPDRAGNATCAFRFDNSGAAEFLSTAGTAFLNNLPQYSISLWYCPADSGRPIANYETLIGRDNAGGCPDRSGQWSLGLYDCRRAVFGRQNSVWDKATSSSSCDEERSLRTGTWHHAAVVYDQSANQMRIYRDGVLQEAAVLIGDCGNGAPSYQDIGDLFLGTGYTGSLDDVILYNRVLSDAEIKTLATMEVCCRDNL